MFRSGEEVFLDDVTKAELESALQVTVNIVKSSGQDFVNAVLGKEEISLKTDELTGKEAFYQGYELKENPYE